MKTIAVLRSNVRDASALKVLHALINKYRVDYYSWDREGQYEPVLKHENLRYNNFKVRSGFYSVATLIKVALYNIWLFLILIFAKIDYIHAIDLDTGLVGLTIAKLRKKPFIYHCLDPYHAALPSGWPKMFEDLAKWLENTVISNADVFIITDMLRMPQHEGARPKRILEYANVPLLDLFTEPYKSDKRIFTVGYIGSLVEGRNLLTTVEAVGEQADESIRLVIGGFGPLARDVERLSEKYNNVNYTGYMSYSDVLKTESLFDAFVYINDDRSKSQKWVSPNKLFESMAFGKPIIVGEGTLTAERVSAIGNGVIVKYGSKEELKRAILNLKNNPELIMKMGEVGRNEYIRNFRPEIMEKRLLDVYNDLI